VEEERFRDLARCRGGRPGGSDARRAPAGEVPVAAELEFPGPGGSWTEPHRRWLRSLEFADHASRSVFNDYRAGVVFLGQRRDGLDAQIEIVAPARHGR
jgi:hypothetical protein